MMTLADIAWELHVMTCSTATRIKHLDSDAKKFLLVQPGGDRVQDMYFEPTRSFADIIPSEYHDFASVFSKKEARKLSQHCPYAYCIPIEEGTSPLYGLIYLLSPVELETLQKYIEENLSRRFIRHSQLPCGAPILFVKKADRSLQLCVDYWGLNKIYIKNCHPLLLIGELLHRLSGAKYFTKLDMQDGYYLFWTAKSEEWKTAVRCRYGLIEYQVMPFGLCNAPGTFQHFVNNTFSYFLDQFLTAYLDHLLIYSNLLEEHKIHVCLVLE
jgi:hypothetical protein